MLLLPDSPAMQETQTGCWRHGFLKLQPPFRRFCLPGMTNRLVCMQIEDDATSTPALWQREHPAEARSFLGAQMPAKKVEECSQAEMCEPPQLSAVSQHSPLHGGKQKKVGVCSGRMLRP